MLFMCHKEPAQRRSAICSALLVMHHLTCVMSSAAAAKAASQSFTLSVGGLQLRLAFQLARFQLACEPNDRKTIWRF